MFDIDEILIITQKFLAQNFTNDSQSHAFGSDLL